MTSKEKAIHLVDNQLSIQWECAKMVNKDLAKQCAIICAKEIMETDWYIPTLSAAIDWKIIYETRT